MTKMVRKNTKAIKLETNKNTKGTKTKDKALKGCVATLVIQIIITVLLSLLPLAPFFGWLFALAIFVFIVIGVVITTICSFGMLWIAEEFRNFWAKAWKAMEDCFNSTEAIVKALQPHIVWISILVFLISSVGFIYNLVYYKKHNKSNKGCFIASCVVFGVALIAMIAAMIVILTYKPQ